MTIPTTPTELRQFLAERGITVDRKLGQHFLTDRNMLRWIAEQAELAPKDVVLEIGTGTGLLTNELARRAGVVVTVDMDAAMFALSRELLRDFKNVRQHHADILEKRDKLNPAVLADVRDAMGSIPGALFKVVSNIPYGISSPVIIDLVSGDLPYERIVLTIQLEVAERLVAPSGSKDYGFLSVVTQYHSETKILRQLPPQVFWPQPKVNSAVVKLTPRAEKPPLKDYATFRAVARAIFDYRRKNFLNALALSEIGKIGKTRIKDAIEKSGLDPLCRGESLTVAQICALANFLSASDSRR
jgi:16S rRNA (adenine1518-N6/adenine1519-N6)-dimethyltransferase